ncbi:hypothetical protein [Blastococcus sp. TF02A-26]|uniref:hypothetical protein n=1 Tax=Blastococcus sp. TF02A-26 TaxID=2250577 RepID=UPI000DE8F6FE|nr:hypothetical protein [Blastococcus sp. TF02A-26]RBY84378.1 hypothetical protein DQ240_14765 [Blastococcus sp. TF02A-26]
MPNDLDLRDLDEVRRRVVLPVVRSLVRPDELEDVVVDVVLETPPPYRVPGIAPGEAHASVLGLIFDVPESRLPPVVPDQDIVAEEWVSVRIKARGEWVEPIRWFPGDGEAHDPQWLAAGLYSQLQDELAESRFAWGELREGDYELPGPDIPGVAGCDLTTRRPSGPG